jgi:hypothetical protein
METKTLPPNAGKGRVKGVPNTTTKLLKEAILQAADKAGGKDGLVGYLTTQAKKNPKAFLPLLGKVLPLQVTGEGGGPVQLIVERRIVRANPD